VSKYLRLILIKFTLKPAILLRVFVLHFKRGFWRIYFKICIYLFAFLRQCIKQKKYLYAFLLIFQECMAEKDERQEVGDLCVCAGI